MPLLRRWSIKEVVETTRLLFTASAEVLFGGILKIDEAESRIDRELGDVAEAGI